MEENHDRPNLKGFQIWMENKELKLKIKGLEVDCFKWEKQVAEMERREKMLQKTIIQYRIELGLEVAAHNKNE